MNNLHLERNGSEIIEAIEVPDLKLLIEKAEDIIREADKEIKLDPWPNRYD